MGLYDFTFYDLICRNATAFGSRICWYEADSGRQVTFAEYKAQVDRLAAGLKRVGISQGARIGVVGQNSLAFFILYGAAAAVGAIVLPVNWRLAADEVCFNLNDGTPQIVFVDETFQSMLKTHQAELPSVERYFNLKSDAGGFESFTAVSDDSGGIIFEPVKADAGLVIIHTAAVAGRPRGALLSHANVMCADIHFMLGLGLTSGDVHLNLLPLFHVAGLFMATAAFHAGALTVNMDKFDAKQAVDLIAEKKVTFFFDFPPILASILESAEADAVDIGSLKAVMGLGIAKEITQFQETTGGTYYTLYGQTETSGLASMGPYNDRPGAAGKTIALADIRLVDELDRPVPAGAVGEIAVKGPMIFKGYWKLPKDNAYTFRDGWHHTGDLGRFDEDGFLFYAGRKPEKELIKPGGENVYPAEVEKTILAHPAVAETVVIGVPHPKWKEGIKAVCRLHSGQTLTAEALIDFVGERIARFKKPQFVEFVKALPQLVDGTPDRAQVKTLYGRE